MRSVVAKLASAIALCSMSTTAVQAAGEEKCLEPAEAQALLMFILPGAFVQLTDQCRSVLPADATLTRVGKQLAERYQPEADAAWPTAKVAFGKMADAGMMKLLGDETLKKLVSAGIANEIPKSVQPKDCGTVDRFVAALEPLPARNMAMLVGAFIDIGAKRDASGKSDSPFNICKPAVPISSPKPAQQPDTAPASSSSDKF